MCVHTIDANNLCHGEILHDGIVSITIDKCFGFGIVLPFPTLDAYTLSDSIVSIV